MKKKFLFLMVILFTGISAQNAGAVLLDFEDLNVGDSYNVPDSFYSSEIKIDVGEFYPTTGGSLSGTAVVGNGGVAGHLGNEMEIYNVNLHFLLGDSGCPSCGLFLLFGYNGGDVNLGINGTVNSYTSFADIPPNEVIDGATITVRGTQLGALLVVNGNIEVFTIGGQEIAIDSILACEIPEPMTIALLGLGSLSLVLRRKQS